MKADKSQIIRLADVFVIAPYMVYVGRKYNRPAMTALGVATALYNGNNFIKNLK